MTASKDEPTGGGMRAGDPRSPGDGSSREAATVASRELQGGARRKGDW